MLRVVLGRKHQPNLSFFAFTATPKYKTLATFGRKEANGNPEPFHLYTMKQAIEEGFILDVLKHYTTYKVYYRLVKAAEDDPEVGKRKATTALARLMRLHPYNVAQKTEIMAEHYRRHVRHRIGGKAKAMLVTNSRLEAVRYKREFDRYITEKAYDFRTLVAFSGTLVDEEFDAEQELSEAQMNGGIAEKGLPVLHTMYVDKRLADVQAVQTLSRLNRGQAWTRRRK